MSQPSSTPSPTDIDRLKGDLAEKTVLVQHVREELIRSQITVLELQDTILQKETDKADAVSLLGRAELLLESKINYIFDLDRVLNEKIGQLTAQLAEERATHENITRELVEKLDQTNRDLSAAHQLARNYAREVAETKELLASAAAARVQFEATHAQIKTELAAVRGELTSCQSTLEAISLVKTALERELDAIHHSFAWKISAPFRWLSKRG